MSRKINLDMSGVDGGPTPAQAELIERITIATGKIFRGTTRKSASDFIDANIDDMLQNEEHEEWEYNETTLPSRRFYDARRD